MAAPTSPPINLRAPQIGLNVASAMQGANAKLKTDAAPFDGSSWQRDAQKAYASALQSLGLLDQTEADENTNNTSTLGELLANRQRGISSLADLMADRGLTHSGINLGQKAQVNEGYDAMDARQNQLHDTRLRDIIQRRLGVKNGYDDTLDALDNDYNNAYSRWLLSNLQTESDNPQITAPSGATPIPGGGGGGGGGGGFVPSAPIASRASAPAPAVAKPAPVVKASTTPKVVRQAYVTPNRTAVINIPLVNKQIKGPVTSGNATPHPVKGPARMV